MIHRSARPKNQDIENLRWAAEQGDPEAQCNLGNVYYLGEGTPRDYAEAANWYRLAAGQGNAAAQNNLGVMYDEGESVPQDDREAVKWYRKAAEQGNAAAQYNLGVMYDLGEGVPKDWVKAYAWLSLSAANGKENAARGKDLLRSRMTAEQVAEGQKLAAELFDRIESSQSQ